MAKGESTLNSSDDKNLKYISVENRDYRESYYDKWLFVISIVSVLWVLTFSLDWLNYDICLYIQSATVEITNSSMEFWRRIIKYTIFYFMMRAIYRVYDDYKGDGIEIVFDFRKKLIWYMAASVLNIIRLLILPKWMVSLNVILLYRCVNIISFMAVLVLNRLLMAYVYNKKSSPYMRVDKRFDNIVTVVTFIIMLLINIFIPAWIDICATGR